MLISVKSLHGFRVGASDGLAGGIVDLYFNDQDWSVRHMVTSEHPTRLHKAALLPPVAIRKADARENVLHVALSRAECAALEPASSITPVCRQYLIRNGSHSSTNADPHMRSTTAVTGYELSDPEQHLGIVHDFLIDPRTWTIAFIVGRRFGAQEREFLISTAGVSQISFASRRVAVRKDSNWDLVFEERNGYDRLLHAEAA